MNNSRQIVATIILIVLNETPLNAQWERRYPDIPPDKINDILFINPSTGFAVNSGGSVLMTTDGGDSWNIKAHYQRDVFSQIEFIDSHNGFAISPHSHIDDDIGFIFTTDGGLNWEDAAVVMSDAVAFLPLSTSAVIKSTDAGTIGKLENFFGLWTETYRMRHFVDIDVTVPYGSITQFQRLPGGRILALGSNDRARRAGVITDSVSFILKSDDEGDSWSTLWSDFAYGSYALEFFNDSLGWLGADTNRIYRTTNGGISWSLQYYDPVQSFPIRSISSPDGVFISAVDGSGRVLTSSDSGLDWHSIQVDQHYDYTSTIKFLTPSKGFLSSEDFWVTTNGGTSWKRVSNSLSGDLKKIDFASASIGIGLGGKSIYKTLDGGRTWKVLYESPTQSFCGLDMLDSLNVWATSYDSLYHSVDGGNSWRASQLSDRIALMRGIQFLDAHVGIVFEVWEGDTTYNYVTTDGGNSWTPHTINGQTFVSSFLKIRFTDPRHIWFSNQYGAWLSRDTAKTWTLFPIDGAFMAFDFADSLTGWVSIWGGQFRKMALTTDGGTTWQFVDRPYASQPMDMVSYRDGNYYGGVWMLAAGLGGSLTQFRQGDTYVSDLRTYTGKALNSFATYRAGNLLHLWLAGDGMTVLHQTVLVTGVADGAHEQIMSYALLQNYPNPFNPVTTISFDVPRRSFVSLKVYDLLGREVATVVSEEMAMGSYARSWNAGGLSSGVYFYRLTSGSFSATKKLVLLH